MVNFVSKSPDELLTVAEVAAELKVTEATVRRWINEEKLVARRLAGPGTEFRVIRRELNEMMGIAPAPVTTARPTRPFTSTAGRMSVR